MPVRTPNSLTGYLIAVLSISVVIVALKPFETHVNPTTVALLLLMDVLFVATFFGARPAVAASLLSMLFFNLFYLPPVGTLTIADPDNWVALGAFLITAVLAGQLAVRARRRAEEAEAGRREIERLYNELHDAFERASHTEALKQSERLKSALLDAVTHDLRTPLTSIKASVTTLLDELKATHAAATLDAEGRREMLEVIDEESDRLSHFIESLVDLARIEAGEMHLRLRLRSVDEIIPTALKRAESLTQKHRVEVSFPEDLPLVRVDARAVAEVVYTLIDNAAKYSPPGSRISVAAELASADRVRLTVEDEGPGIQPHLRERVFDKFFRVAQEGDPSAAKRSGIGMGLSIAKGIVEAHGGHIWIEDRNGKRGTRVALTLPTGQPGSNHTNELSAGEVGGE